jgi:hypothetical protein
MRNPSLKVFQAEKGARNSTATEEAYNDTYLTLPYLPTGLP